VRSCPRPGKKQFSTAPERYKKQIEFVSKNLGSKDGMALERFATAIYVTLDLNTPPRERAVKSNALKPHVSIPQGRAGGPSG
jgi:hypothetical protein